MPDVTTARDDVRAKIVAAAVDLLREHGAAAVTTRGVAQGAHVQPPTIYRLFGDKDGLLDAVAEHALAEHVSAKKATVDDAEARGVDPLVELREGWRSQVEFGVANPDIFRYMSDPSRMARSSATEAGMRVFETRIRRVAESGRLRVSERRAIGLVQAAGLGAIQALLTTSAEERDWSLADDIYEAVLAQILTDAPSPIAHDRAATVVAFRAIAPTLDILSNSERQLMIDWLDRAIAEH